MVDFIKIIYNWMTKTTSVSCEHRTCQEPKMLICLKNELHDFGSKMKFHLRLQFTKKQVIEES